MIEKSPGPNGAGLMVVVVVAIVGLVVTLVLTSVVPSTVGPAVGGVSFFVVEDAVDLATVVGARVVTGYSSTRICTPPRRHRRLLGSVDRASMPIKIVVSAAIAKEFAAVSSPVFLSTLKLASNLPRVGKHVAYYH